MPNIWGDIATWISAIATWMSVVVTSIGVVVTCITGTATWIALLVAFIQIKDERDARKKAEKEKSISERRNQAEKITVWVSDWYRSGIAKEITISNQSLHPVYNLGINIIELKDESHNNNNEQREKIWVKVAPPGYWYFDIGREQTKEEGIEFAFEDGMGIYWLRKKTGELSEIKSSPIKHYNINIQNGWRFINKKSQKEKEDEERIIKS